MSIALAITYHDPQGRLIDQIEKTLPILTNLFDGIAVRASYASQQEPVDVFKSFEAVIYKEHKKPTDGPKLGIVRREALELGVSLGTSFVMVCDGDRALHWAEHYPDELAQVVLKIQETECTILGRTERAYKTHPKALRDTEAIVNHIFHIITGNTWDMMVGARGFSQQAANAILKNCMDDQASVDVSWPLYLRMLENLSMQYIAAEGLEFETPDRFQPEITAAGGYQNWLNELDQDLQHWLFRVGYIQRYLEVMLPYAQGKLQ